MTNHKLKLFVIVLLAMPLALSAATQDYNRDLLSASALGDCKAIENALQNGANVNTVDSYQRTPLHRAADNGRTDIVNALILAKATVDARNQHQEAPLHLAATCGHTNVVNALLLAKATVDTRNQDKETPLHYAARYAHTEAVKVLLDCGANFNLENKYNENAIAFARSGYSSDKNIIIEIIEDFANTRKLMLDQIPKIILDLQLMPSPLARLIAQYCYAFSEERDIENENNSNGI